MKIKYLLVLLLLFLSGCDKATFALCLFKNSQDECVNQMIQSDSSNTPVPVIKGEQAYSHTKIYSLQIPSSDWTQLRSGSSKIFPNRDLRLLHNTGTGFIDGSTFVASNTNAYDLAKSALNEAALPSSGTLVELADDRWLGKTKEASFLRYCFIFKDKVEFCAYSLAIKDINYDVIIFASMANIEARIEEIEQILLSVTLHEQ